MTPEERRWAERPMRYMGDSEVRAALTEREQALSDASNPMAAQLCQIAIDKLRKELSGREARKATRFGG